MTFKDKQRIAKEREIFRSTGYAVVSNILEEPGNNKTALHSDPESLEAIAHAWIARQSGLDERKWIRSLATMTKIHKCHEVAP